MSSELEALVEQKSREEWNQNGEIVRSDLAGASANNDNPVEPIVDFADEDIADPVVDDEDVAEDEN